MKLIISCSKKITSPFLSYRTCVKANFVFLFVRTIDLYEVRQLRRKYISILITFISFLLHDHRFKNLNTYLFVWSKGQVLHSSK